jgi:hypothetical protein
MFTPNKWFHKNGGRGEGEGRNERDRLEIGMRSTEYKNDKNN